MASGVFSGENFIRAQNKHFIRSILSAFRSIIAVVGVFHRFRKDRHPQTLEAKILFDADKLDVTGALGIARTLLYQGDRKQPLYTRRSDGTVCDGTQNPQNSFFREYQVKLAKLYDRFYTDEGSRIAGERKQIAEAFYGSLYREITMSEAAGGKLLQEKLEECALP